MRFNPKADISGGRVSDASGGGAGGRAGGGLGGLGGGRLPIPGGGKGAGGLVIVLVVMVIGYFVSGSPGLGGGGNNAAPDSSRYDQCLTGEDANKSADCARRGVEATLADYWSKTLPEQSSAAFADTEIKTFGGGVSTGCGNASAAMGPFYCPSDQTIYLDTDFFAEVLQGQLSGPAGDFVEPYVLAHEYGHHIQNLLGTMNRMRTQKGAKSDSVRLELQADCYAGMWAGAAFTTRDGSGERYFEDEFSRQDIDQAMAAAKTVGDDYIQQRSGGRVDSDSWTHGSSAERQRWFQTGYSQGTLTACDTFAPDAL